MEEPAVLAEVGSVADLRILDLGCGDGLFGRFLLERGARSYLEVDSSVATVAAAAQTLAGSAAEVRQARIEDFGAAAGRVDLIVSRLALHYVEPLAAVLQRCRTWLAPGGRLLITVVHPVITSHDARADTDVRRTNWVVDDYFGAGPRPQSWMGADVLFHHRTVEEYFAAFREAGFEITALLRDHCAAGISTGAVSVWREFHRVPTATAYSALPSAGRRQGIRLALRVRGS
jgi:trans-aconitate methyltransferase